MTLLTGDAERLLKSWLGQPLKEVQYIIGFQSFGGRVLALDRRPRVARVWFLPPLRPIAGVTYIAHAKNDDLNGPLKSLNARVAQRAEFASEAALQEFLTWYCTSSPAVLWIDRESEGFPATAIPNGLGRLDTSWDEILWAAITVGRPNTFHVFRHGDASLHEARFRWSMIRMALQQRTVASHKIIRTELFKQMDPTEKGAVNYFLGLALCKLFAWKLLDAPWTIHLDVFRNRLAPGLLSGRSRPDMVAQSQSSGAWHAFECKGRASTPGAEEKRKAKAQAQRLVSVGGAACQLHIGCITYFRKDAVEFYWRDPEPDKRDGMDLPETPAMWAAYYEPFYRAFRHAQVADGRTRAYPDGFAEMPALDILLGVHPKIERYLANEDWSSARNAADDLQEMFINDGYQPDGLKVVAGSSWSEARDVGELR